ncbi:MAG: DUF4347 domain-containing protein [Lentisphaerae bacterium]|nr:DUF4347 domain-containing protein [Lentisphaerota bacterium]
MKDFEFFKLEDRVLFEAAAAAEIVEAVEAAQNDPNADVSESERQAQEERNALKNAPPENPAAMDHAPADDSPENIADVNADIDALIDGEIPPGMMDEASGRELVVINSSMPDKEAFINALEPDQEVLILDNNTGLAELNAFLDGSDVEYSAIHLVSHGGEGHFVLNGELISSGKFDAAAWQAIGEHLSENGDIMLYGCDVAAGAEGKALVDMISQASGADVAASTDVTGISGNWELEYHAGTIETAEIEVDEFAHDLDTITVDALEADDTAATTTLQEAIELAYNNAGADVIVFADSLNGKTIEIDSALEINDSVQIIGNGVSETIIDGGGVSGIFEYYDVLDGKVDISISNMTLQNGFRSVNTPSGEDGGAIYINAFGINSDDSITLSLDNVTIADSHASNGGGVAIIADYCDVELNIRNSTFYGNNAVAGTSGDGGAVYVISDGFVINVIDSTITGNYDANSSGYTGGGIFAKADEKNSEMNIVNSIIFGNYNVDSSGAMAGASDIYSVSDASAVTVTNRMIHSIYGVTLEGSAPGDIEWDVAVENNSFKMNVLDSSGKLDAQAYSEAMQKVFGTDSPALDANNVIQVNNGDIAGYAGTLTGYDANGNLVYMKDDGSWADLNGNSAGQPAGATSTLFTDELGNSRTTAQSYLGINEFFIGAVAGKTLIKVVGDDAAVNTHKYDGASKDLAVTYMTAGGSVVSSAGKLTIDADGLNTADVASDGIGKDAGDYLFCAKDITVSISYDSSDITGKFDFSGANVPAGADASVADAEVGTVKITPRQITFTSASDEKFYDGTVLTNDNVTVSGDGFVTGEGADFDVTGEQLFVGTSDNTFTYTLNSGTLAQNYVITTVLGILEVKQASISVTITTGSAQKFYDGTELTNTTYTYSGTLATGDQLTVTTTGSQLNSGSSQNTFDYYITHDGTDVSANYNIQEILGTLQVDKRTVVITADSDSKKYDGTELTDSGYTYSAFDADTGYGFATGEGLASVTVIGSRLNAGTSYNEVTNYTLLSGTDAGNYIITTEKGELTVYKRNISITVNSGQSMTYGDTLPTLEYTVGEDGMANGEVLNGTLEIDNPQYSSSNNLKAGDYDIIQGSLIEGSNPNYKIISFTGAQFTVDQKELGISQITVNDKTYDGTTDATLSGGTFSGAVAGDDVTVDWSNADADFVSPDAGNDIQVDVTGGLGLTGSDAENYKLPDSYHISGSGDIDPKDVTVHFVSDSPYLYDSTDQSGKVSAYYVDIHGNKVDLPINWNGKIFAAVGDYEISVTISDSNYNALNPTATVTILPFNPAGADYSDGVSNPKYSGIIPSIQGDLTANGIGGDGIGGDNPYGNIYTMNYAELVSHTMLNYGRGIMDQQLLIRGNGPSGAGAVSQVDILEYKPMTLDSPMRESAVFEVTGTVNPQGVISGNEIFSPGSDAVIEVRGDAPVESPESLYIDGDEAAESLPWSELPQLDELQSKADNFKSDFEKAIEEMLLA